MDIFHQQDKMKKRGFIEGFTKGSIDAVSKNNYITVFKDLINLTYAELKFGQSYMVNINAYVNTTPILKSAILKDIIALSSNAHEYHFELTEYDENVSTIIWSSYNKNEKSIAFTYVYASDSKSTNKLLNEELYINVVNRKNKYLFMLMINPNGNIAAERENI